jgi:predicted DNA-binding transcriptional regulator YafY
MTLRPQCQSKNGNIWEFNCTRLQALRYFCRMAPDCEILEPRGLRKDMIKFLKTAAKNYEKTEDKSDE